MNPLQENMVVPVVVAVVAMDAVVQAVVIIIVAVDSVFIGGSSSWRWRSGCSRLQQHYCINHWSVFISCFGVCIDKLLHWGLHQLLQISCCIGECMCMSQWIVQRIHTWKKHAWKHSAYHISSFNITYLIVSQRRSVSYLTSSILSYRSLSIFLILSYIVNHGNGNDAGRVERKMFENYINLKNIEKRTAAWKWRWSLDLMVVYIGNCKSCTWHTRKLKYWR